MPYQRDNCITARKEHVNDDCEIGTKLMASRLASATRACGLRTDPGPLCQILDIIRFNDPSWMPLFLRSLPRTGPFTTGHAALAAAATAAAFHLP